MADELPKSLGRYALQGVYLRAYYGPLLTAEVTSGDDAGRHVRVRMIDDRDLDPWDVTAVTKAAKKLVGKQHPHIVPVREVIDGEPAGIVSESFDGDTMANVLRLVSARHKAVPLEIVLRVGLDLLEAVSFLHQLDAPAFGGLTPECFVLSSDGKARLLEPGVTAATSKLRVWQKSPKRIGYDPPEAVDGSPSERSDIFSVAAILWELVFGKRVLTGATYEVIAKRLKQGPLPRADEQKRSSGAVPSDLADVFEQALSVDPTARFNSAEAMARALESTKVTPANHAAVARLLGGLAPRRGLGDDASDDGSKHASRLRAPTAKGAQNGRPGSDEVGTEASLELGSSQLMSAVAVLDSASSQLLTEGVDVEEALGLLDKTIDRTPIYSPD